jgi:hypothetical protein
MISSKILKTVLVLAIRNIFRKIYQLLQSEKAPSLYHLKQQYTINERAKFDTTFEFYVENLIFIHHQYLI